MLQLFDSKSSLMAALGALLDWFLLSLLTWIAVCQLSPQGLHGLRFME